MSRDSWSGYGMHRDPCRYRFPPLTTAVTVTEDDVSRIATVHGWRQ
jgi:hypothetical protein